MCTYFKFRNRNNASGQRRTEYEGGVENKKRLGCSFSMGLLLLVVCVTDRSHGREKEERATAQTNNRYLNRKEEYHMSRQSEQTDSNEQASITFG